MIVRIGRKIKLIVFHVRVRVVDRVNCLSRSGVQPEMERLLRENPTLKAQARVFVLGSMSEWGAQLWIRATQFSHTC